MRKKSLVVDQNFELDESYLKYKLVHKSGYIKGENSGQIAMEASNHSSGLRMYRCKIRPTSSRRAFFILDSATHVTAVSHHQILSLIGVYPCRQSAGERAYSSCHLEG